MWKLIVIWEDCKREEFLYPSEKEAEEAEKGYLMAFGSQIDWTCVIPNKGGSKQ